MIPITASEWLWDRSYDTGVWLMLMMMLRQISDVCERLIPGIAAAKDSDTTRSNGRVSFENGIEDVMVRLSGCDGKGQCERVRIRSGFDSVTQSVQSVCQSRSSFSSSSSARLLLPPRPRLFAQTRLRLADLAVTRPVVPDFNLDAITWTTPSTELTQDTVLRTQSMGICV